MIEFTKSFKVGDKVFATIEEAQKHELELLLDAADESAINQIINSKDKVVDILTTKAGSLPKARKVNGGRKVRSAKPVTNQPSEPDATQPFS
jgi:hypothetical protein